MIYSRASIWYEENGLEIEAFRHAAAADDVERAARLVEGEGMPLYFRGAMIPVLNWMDSLPTAVLDARPSLLVTYLVFKSGYIPKILGILLIIAGLGYLVDSFAIFLLPNFEASIAMVTFIGELLFMFWLLFKGSKTPEVQS